MKYAARFLVVVLLLSLFTPCLQAEDALPFTYEIKNNEVILTSYTGPDSGTVVIPDEIEGLPVTAFGKQSFWTQEYRNDQYTEVFNPPWRLCLERYNDRSCDPAYGHGLWSGFVTGRRNNLLRQVFACRSVSASTG